MRAGSVGKEVEEHSKRETETERQREEGREQKRELARSRSPNEWAALIP